MRNDKFQIKSYIYIYTSYTYSFFEAGMLTNGYGFELILTLVFMVFELIPPSYEPPGSLVWSSLHTSSLAPCLPQLAIKTGQIQRKVDVPTWQLCQLLRSQIVLNIDKTNDTGWFPSFYCWGWNRGHYELCKLTIFVTSIGLVAVALTWTTTSDCEGSQVRAMPEPKIPMSSNVTVLVVRDVGDALLCEMILHIPAISEVWFFTRVFGDTLLRQHQRENNTNIFRFQLHLLGL